MKLQNKIMVAALVLVSSALCVTAQEAGGPPPQDGPGGGQGGPGMGRNRMPPPPLVTALDANHDGVIDATEIDHAAAALRKLDKNGDGKLTPDELRPPRPEGRDGAGAGNFDRPRGQRGQGGFGGPGGQGGQGRPQRDLPPED